MLVGPAGRPAVRRAGGVDRVDERLVDAAPGVGPGLEQVVEALVAQALDLAAGNVGRAASSASSSSAGSSRAAGTSTLIAKASQPASAWSDGARAARRPRPGRRRRSAPCPRSGPGRERRWRRRLAAGSSTAPPCAGSATPRRAAGPGRSTRPARCRPFDRTVRSNCGKWYGRGWPGRRPDRRSTSAHAAGPRSFGGLARRCRPPARRSGRRRLSARKTSAAHGLDLLGRHRQVARRASR